MLEIPKHEYKVAIGMQRYNFRSKQRQMNVKSPSKTYSFIQRQNKKTCKLKYYDVKWNGLNMSKIFLKIGPCDTEYNNNTIRKKTHTR